MTRHFTQKHYVHAADEVAKSTGFRHETVGFAVNLAIMFAMDGEGKFKEGLFLKACGFEGATVESLRAELNIAADLVEAAAGR